MKKYTVLMMGSYMIVPVMAEEFSIKESLVEFKRAGEIVAVFSRAAVAGLVFDGVA